MDMHFASATPSTRLHYPAPASEYASLAEHRRQLFTLIGEFRKAVARPRGRKEAIRILKAVLPCSSAYFGIADLVHALDTLVMHEATIRLRAPENRASTRSSVATAPPL